MHDNHSNNYRVLINSIDYLINDYDYDHFRYFKYYLDNYFRLLIIAQLCKYIIIKEYVFYNLSKYFLSYNCYNIYYYYHLIIIYPTNL